METMRQDCDILSCQRETERERERERERDRQREREREREISSCKNKEYKKAKSFIWMF